jgi:tRNA U34 5-methylaminomethyl-2-thiouridine-forming methyltransferase MnmC
VGKWTLIVKSADGSNTKYSKLFDEHYHCVSEGALKESLSKHVIPAFDIIKKDTLNILDICFGLGYNTLATLYYIKQNSLDIKVNIFSPEFDKELIESLKEFEYPKELKEFNHIIQSLCETSKYSDENIFIELFVGDAREYVKNLSSIDIVYQDAFSSTKNPLLWTKEYFADIKDALSDDAIITTYSQATNVRMSMFVNNLYIYQNINNDVRSGTLATTKEQNLPFVDMILKQERNPNAKPLSDKDTN